VDILLKGAFGVFPFDSNTPHLVQTSCQAFDLLLACLASRALALVNELAK